MAFPIPSIFFAQIATTSGEVSFDPPVEFRLYAEIVKDKPTQYLGYVEGTDVAFCTSDSSSIPAMAYESLHEGIFEAIPLLRKEGDVEGMPPWLIRRMKNLIAMTNLA